MKIFCDTSFIIGFYDSNDKYHRPSQEILQLIKPQNPQLVISDYVYDEASTFLLETHYHYGYLRAMKFEDDIFIKNKYTSIFIGEQLFYRAKEIFRKYNKDKKWSFTDCTSFALMEDYGIKDVLTFDKNFKEMGFKMIK